SETNRQNSAFVPRSSIRRRHLTRRISRCRGDFRDHATISSGDRTGWLGREDSNLRVAESKSAALPLGYAPSGGFLRRADHSDRNWANQRLAAARLARLTEGSPQID